MTLDQAYEKLGLTPLDTFLRQSGDPHRRTGASTWMVVSAALEVLRKKHVLIVARTLGQAATLAESCRAYVALLDGSGSPCQKGRRMWVRPDGGVIEWTSDKTLRTAVVGRPVMVFQDMLWHADAYARIQGPYFEIDRILLTPEGSYQAFNKGGDFLLELSSKGAGDLCSNNTGIHKIGW